MIDTPDRLMETFKQEEEENKAIEANRKFNITSDCRNCIFATWTEHGPDNSNVQQRGCEFGRIERFRIHGGVEEVSTEQDGKTITSYEIQRVCNKHRNNEWAKVHQKDILGDLEKEVAFKMSFLIYLDKNSLVEDLIECLKSIEKQTLKPIDVVVLNNYSEIRPMQISEILDSRNLCSWQNIKMYRKSSKNEAINDDGYKHISGQYFGQIALPCVLKPDFIEQIDIALNTRLERFLSIEYKDNPNVIVLQTRVAKLLNTVDIVEKTQVNDTDDENKKLVEKLEENTGIKAKLSMIAGDQKQESMIKVW